MCKGVAHLMTRDLGHSGFLARGLAGRPFADGEPGEPSSRRSSLRPLSGGQSSAAAGSCCREASAKSSGIEPDFSVR